METNKLADLVGQLVRVKDRHVVGKKRSAVLLAVSQDGARGYLRLTKTGTKLEARADEIVATAFGEEMARRVAAA